MGDTTPFICSHDAVPEPYTLCPEEDCGRLVREARGRIETDRLWEQSLQRHILVKLEYARVRKRSIRD